MLTDENNKPGKSTRCTFNEFIKPQQAEYEP